MKARFENTKNKICPKCGQEYSWLEVRRTKHNTYVYAVHCFFEGRKRRVKKCYLGAKDIYKYVERVHFDLSPRFRGLHDRNRVLDYLEAITYYLENNAEDFDIETLENLRDRLEGFLAYLDAIIYRMREEE